MDLTLYEGKFKWHIQHLAAQSVQAQALQHQFNISHQQVAQQSTSKQAVTTLS
jgi:hypothetical protein